jgi:hypothetical protein
MMTIGGNNMANVNNMADYYNMATAIKRSKNIGSKAKFEAKIQSLNRKSSHSQKSGKNTVAKIAVSRRKMLKTTC